MFIEQFLSYLVDFVSRVLSLLFLDPINAFCLLFLFFNTAGYLLVLTFVAKIRYKGENKPPPMGKVEKTREEFPMISFIIPARNEEKTIERKIKNTVALNYPKDRLEVIVIDDGSTDKTASILEEIRKSYVPELKIIKQDGKGKSSAENEGLQNSKGEIIVISDADVPLNKDALLFLVEDFKKPDVGGVTCTIHADKGYVLSLNLDSALHARKLENKIDSVFGMSGPFVSFRRTLVPKIDERIFSSDTDTGVVVRKKGYRVIYDPGIVSYVDQWIESRPKTMLGALRKLKHMSFGNISVLMRHHDVLFRSSYGLFGWIIAPRHLFLTVFAPVIFVLFSVNFTLKLMEANLLIPFSLLVGVFLFVAFLLRKIASESLISRAFYLFLMYAVSYYAQFFYYLLFLSGSSQRRGIWGRR